MTTSSKNLLGEPAPTYLPEWAEPEALRASDADPKQVAAQFPSYSPAWADLADQAFAAGEVIASYAYARVGYHRGLDALRRNGWRGFGAIPWSHQPNQGFLRSVHALGRAAEAIDETDEAERCATFLNDSDPTAAQELKG